MLIMAELSAVESRHRGRRFGGFCFLATMAPPSRRVFIAALHTSSDLLQGCVALNVGDAADKAGRPVLACGGLVADSEFARERSARLQYLAVRKFNAWPF